MRGRVWKFGDDVNTDVIMPGKYLSMRDPAEIAPYIMEGIDPEFGRKASPGDIIVAGKNFGCGSSRETAPGGLKAFGIGCVIAPTFARIFLRNAINIGLPVLEAPEAARAIREGDVVSVDFGAGLISDETTGAVFRAVPFPAFLQEMITLGGLIPYARRRLGLG
ncbi:MAG TPA: 3-isopropylmalate dehydratase small subunit [Methylomirabilota bacterium]|nr:3-isopropylmalate dehydratase small subunit [Methylomirabilota bacterium]